MAVGRPRSGKPHQAMNGSLIPPQPLSRLRARGAS